MLDPLPQLCGLLWFMRHKKMMALFPTGVLALALTSATAGSAVAASQSCRTYSSVFVCGKLALTEKQDQCVTDSVRLGMTERRAQVECHTFI
jgi:hypothetical protein